MKISSCVVCSKVSERPTFCQEHAQMFQDSPEFKKVAELSPKAEGAYPFTKRQYTFRMDFVNRIRAERLNAGNGT